MYDLIAKLGSVVIRFFRRLLSAPVRLFAFLLRGLAFLWKRFAAALRAAAVPEEANGRPSAHMRASSGGVRNASAGTHKTAALWVVPLVSLLIAVITVLHFFSSRTALRIDAGDTLIGYAAAESDYLAARSAAEARIRCGGASFDGKLPEVTFKAEIVDVNGYTAQEQMTDRLLANVQGEMTEACGVFIDGKFVGAMYNETDAEEIFASVLNDSKNRMDANASCFFGEDIAYVPGLYPDSPDCLRGAEALREAARSLTVMTTRTETVNEAVGFSVVEIPSRTLSVNTARTILEGENGMDQVTRVVTYADGKAVSSKEVSRVTVTQPVSMRRLVGTKMYSMPVVQTFSSVTQLIWPVDGAYNINSDYAYRWGKFHYGLDIGVGSAPGTSLGMNVLAAADGVVELATTHSSYGYYIILDHGNGMETVYGHLLEDSFKVRPGDTVRQGQPIARVGQTGYATGPHLHFEVRVNGNKLDPKLFLQQYKGIGY